MTSTDHDADLHGRGAIADVEDVGAPFIAIATSVRVLEDGAAVLGTSLLPNGATPLPAFAGVSGGTTGNFSSN